MQALNSNKQVLQWLCVYPIDENASEWKKWGRIAFALFLFASHCLGIATGGVFLWKYISSDLEGSLYALFQISACISVAYVLVIALIIRQKITATIDQLTDIYIQFKDLESFRYLTEANNTSERMWTLYFKYVIVGFVILTTTASALSIVVCFMTNGHLVSSEFYRPYKLILPWNQSTMIGYIGEITVDIDLAETYYTTNGTFLLLFISICLQHQAFYKMYQYSVSKWDQAGKDGSYEKFLRNLIRSHITTKEWFLASAEAYSPLIVVQLICGMLFTSCIIFQIDLYSEQIDFVFCTLLSAGLTSLINLFLYCFFGKQATDNFVDMGDCLYNANWHDVPIRLQKYFILMISNTQKPLQYHGFRIAYLNRVTFCAMLRTVMTYYMMFKAITE